MPYPDVERWWRPFARAGDAGVMHVDLTPRFARDVEACGWLNGDERSRRERFRHAGRRRQYTLCRAALRAILCGRLGCANEVLSFGEEGRGKPVALLSGNPAPVSFSVSHSGIHGLIAVAMAGRLGVDVEERVPRRDLDALMVAVLMPDERAEIEAAGGGERIGRFYGLWTIKEALVKALGTGLHLDMAGLEVPAAMRRGGDDRRVPLPALFPRWRGGWRTSATSTSRPPSPTSGSRAFAPVGDAMASVKR